MPQLPNNLTLLVACQVRNKHRHS